MNRSDFLIIGSSAAGIAAAKTLAKLKPSGSVTIITKDSHDPYNKCLLVDVATNTRPLSTLALCSHQFLQEAGINLIKNSTVTKLDPHAKQVQTSAGVWSYSHLLIATGTQPRTLPLLTGYTHVYSFHTLDDLHMMLDNLSSATNPEVLVIGAGLSGLEATDALRHLGARVTLITRASGPLPTHLSTEGQAVLINLLQEHGVTFRAHESLAQVTTTKSDHLEVALSSGTQLEVTSICCTMGGISAASDLLASADVRNQDGFVIVDDHMRTSQPDIFAAGDAIMTRNLISGTPCRSTLWPDAVQQGITAAHSMLGLSKPYAGCIPLVSSSLFGKRFVSCGYIKDPIVMRREVLVAHGTFQEVCYDVNDELIGFSLIGDTSPLAALRAQLKKAST